MENQGLKVAQKLPDREPVEVRILPLEREVTYQRQEFIKMSSKFFSGVFSENWSDVIQNMRGCTQCGVRKEAINVVPPEFNLDAEIVLQGRNPGCFSVRTSVKTQSGNIPAHVLVNKKLEESVESVDFRSKKVVVKPIINWFRNGSTGLWNKIIWNESCGFFTDDHEFYKNCIPVKVSELGDEDFIDGVDYKFGYPQEQILLGTLLGDSSVMRDKRLYKNGDKKFAYVEFDQGIEQYKYLLWKTSFFEPLLIKSNFDERNKVYKLSTIYSRQFDWYFDSLKEGVSERRFKKINSEWFDKMDTLAYAVWFMDDGYTEVKINKTCTTYCCTIGCNNFGIEGADYAAKRISKFFGVDTSVYKGKEKNGNDRLRIRIHTRDSDLFLLKIAPYVHSSMNYKLGRYSEYQKIEFESRLQKTVIEKYIKVRKKQRLYDSSKVRYSIEVQGTHNYVLEGGVISKNSQEDKLGRPFVPTAPGGKWFMKYLDALGVKRNDVYITNSLLCHTYQDRIPVMKELVTCSLWKTIEYDRLKNAKYLFLLGNDAIRQTFNYDFPSIVRIFGNIYQATIFGRKVMFFPCYHPMYSGRYPDTLAIDQFSFLATARILIEEDRKGNLKWVI